MDMKYVKGTTAMKNRKSDDFKRVYAKISKLACGRSCQFDGIGKIKAFKTKTGARRFSVSNSESLVNCGNIPLDTLRESVRFVYTAKA